MAQPRKSAFAPPYVGLIETLVSRRRELGPTQTDVGLAFGEDQSFISRVERCQRRIDVLEFVRLCRILQLRAAELVKELEASS